MTEQESIRDIIPFPFMKPLEKEAKNDSSEREIKKEAKAKNKR